MYSGQQLKPHQAETYCKQYELLSQLFRERFSEQKSHSAELSFSRVQWQIMCCRGIFLSAISNIYLEGISEFDGSSQARGCSECLQSEVMWPEEWAVLNSRLTRARRACLGNGSNCETHLVSVGGKSDVSALASCPGGWDQILTSLLPLW